MIDTEYRISFVYNCLVRNGTLATVNLSKMEITSEHAKKIAKVINCNKMLLELDISHNLLGDDGMCTICNSLRDSYIDSETLTVKNKVFNKHPFGVLYVV